MSKPRFTTQQMAAAGIIAAIYAALTLLLPIPQYGGDDRRGGQLFCGETGFGHDELPPFFCLENGRWGRTNAA